MGAHAFAVPRSIRYRAIDAFAYDELGWVLGEAAALTAETVPEPRAYRRSNGLDLLSRHPRLLSPVGEILEAAARARDARFIANWSSDAPIVANADECVAIVLFGAQGGVAVAPAIGFAENIPVRAGRILVLAEGDSAAPLPGAGVGPAFVIRYERARRAEGADTPCDENALWPSAWCC